MDFKNILQYAYAYISQWIEKWNETSVTNSRGPVRLDKGTLLLLLALRYDNMTQMEAIANATSRSRTLVINHQKHRNRKQHEEKRETFFAESWSNSQGCLHTFQQVTWPRLHWNLRDPPLSSKLKSYKVSPGSWRMVASSKKAIIISQLLRQDVKERLGWH